MPLEFEQEPDLRAWRETRVLRVSDPEGALEELKKLAERGSLLAMLDLGRAFALGVGTPRDDTQAEQWLRRAAAARSVRGSYFLGRFLLRTKRYAEAKEAYEFSAARGYPPALHDLGKIYFLGLGVEKDMRLAARYLSQAWEAGSVYAGKDYATLLRRTARGFTEKTRAYWWTIRALFAAGVTAAKHRPDSERLFR